MRFFASLNAYEYIPTFIRVRALVFFGFPSVYLSAFVLATIVYRHCLSNSPFHLLVCLPPSHRGNIFVCMPHLHLYLCALLAPKKQTISTLTHILGRIVTVNFIKFARHSKWREANKNCILWLKFCKRKCRKSFRFQCVNDVGGVGGSVCGSETRLEIE